MISRRHSPSQVHRQHVDGESQCPTSHVGFWHEPFSLRHVGGFASVVEWFRRVKGPILLSNSHLPVELVPRRVNLFLGLDPVLLVAVRCLRRAFFKHLIIASIKNRGGWCSVSRICGSIGNKDVSLDVSCFHPESVCHIVRMCRRPKMLNSLGFLDAATKRTFFCHSALRRRNQGRSTVGSWLATWLVHPRPFPKGFHRERLEEVESSCVGKCNKMTIR